MTFRFPARRRFHSCTLGLLILCEGATLMATEQPTHTTRVRSEQSIIVSAIVDAAGHSATFRSLLEAVEGTDGIVYVREGVCRFGVRRAWQECIAPRRPVSCTSRSTRARQRGAN
jgi:hypothetical protein